METTFSFKTSFLNESPDYAYGCEFGMLYPQFSEDRPIKSYFMTANRDQILLTAEYFGWSVKMIRPSAQEGWFWLELEKKPQAS